MGERFLVIGAGGLVGRHLTVALGKAEVVRTYRGDVAAGGLKLDITDAGAVREAIRESRPHVIFLAAADAYVERCEHDPVGTRRVNVEAARVVASSAKESGALLVVFSSEYVFKGDAGPYSEEDERGPINEYGRQKVALEDMALATGRGLVCRTSAVFGEDPKRKNFMCQVVDRLRSGQTFEVPSDQLVTPTYALALAHAVVELTRAGRTGTYHVAGPEVMGRIEFAEAVARAYGLDISRLHPRATSELGLAAPRPRRAGLDTRKLRETLSHPLLAAGDALRELADADPPRAR
ncbi:MAG: SDR family oxidoreductase [Gaiellales bacterium]